MAVEALSPDHGEAQRLLKLSHLIMAKLKQLLKLSMAVEALSPDHCEAQRLLKLSNLIMAKLKQPLKLSMAVEALSPDHGEALVTAEVGGPRNSC